MNDMEAFEDHLLSLLGKVEPAERELQKFHTMGNRLNPGTRRDAISSVVHATGEAIRLSAAFMAEHEDMYLPLSDTHHTLAEFHGLAIYLRELSSHTNSFNGFEGFTLSFSGWIETLQATRNQTSKVWALVR